MVEVAPFLAGRCAAHAAQLAVDGYQVDQRTPSSHLRQPDLLLHALDPAAQDIAVKPRHAIEVAHAQQPIQSILSVGFPGDYGGDYGAGAKIAAAQLELGDPLFEHLQIPIAFGGTVEEAVGVILEERPTLIVLVTGPTEMAQIAAGVFQGGHQEFQILGASPTWNVVLAENPELMPLLEAVYWNTTPWGGWDSDTPGHEAMRAAAEARGQGPNNAYIAGWLWSHPMKALLEAAIASGDLTKANVAQIARSLENVDHEGMLPTKSYAGDPDENVYRATWIGRADSDASDGVANVVEEFVSPIVEAFPYESPCFVG